MLLKRVFQSPLLHFFVLSGLVFALFAAMNPGSDAAETEPDRIVLSAEDAGQLVRKLSETLGRDPTPEDIDAAMEAWAIEEALVREARALGLDRDDEIIRNRLQQKLLYLAEAPLAAEEPDAAALEAFFAENAARFEIPGVVSFQHVMMSREATAEEIAAALDQLQDGAAPETVGAPPLIPPVFEGMPLSAVDRVFGAGFARQLAGLPEGMWSGPVASGFGPHLVYLSKYSPAELPDLESVRDKVVDQWRQEHLRTARAAFVENVMARYEIEIPDAEEVSLP